MKKTVSINLNSFIFNIDEDAYQAMHEYLTQLGNHFSRQAEGNEIIKDIEARIAEIFSSKIKPGKQVINLEDVLEVIEILGKVEDITGDEAGLEDEEVKEKKLYRNPENAKLAGVCSGLSEYTGISVITWRIIFLILLFAGQIGLVAYLILWLAVPEAKTTAQRIEMKGGKINLSTIEKRVKEEFEGIKNNFNDENRSSFKNFFEQLGRGFVSIAQVIGTVFGKSLGILFLLLGASLLTLLTIGLLHVNQHELVYSGNLVHMIWLPGLLEMITSPQLAWFLSFCILLLFLIPILALIHWGISLFFGIHTARIITKFLSGAWSLAFFLALACIIYIALDFQSVEDDTERTTLLPDSTGAYHIGFSKEYKDFNYRDGEKINDLDDLDRFLNRHFLLHDKDSLQSFVDFDIERTADTVAHAEIRKIARGSDFTDAERNLEKIRYTIKQDSGKVSFSPYFTLQGRKYRGQQVQVTLSIPESAQVFLDSRLEE